MLQFDALIDTVSSFPASVPTVLLVAACLYWLLAVIGLVDSHGGAGLDGGAHAHIDGAHAHGDSGEMGLLAGALLSLGLSGVPLSVVLSVMILQMWVLTTLVHSWLLTGLADPLRWGAGVVLLPVSLLLSMPLTAVLLRPVRGAFSVHNAVANAHLIGKPCRILTGEVSERFGQAHVQDRGNGFTVRVWAAQPNTLRRGSMAVLLNYDSSSQRFEVAALTELEAPPEQPES